MNILRIKTLTVAVILLFAGFAHAQSAAETNYNDLSAITDDTDRRSAFGSLTAAQKVDIIKYQIDLRIAQMNLNPVQTSVLTDLKSLITTGLVAGDSGDVDAFNEWLTDSTKFFTPVQYDEIFLAIGDQENLTAVIDPIAPQCNCSLGSWCSGSACAGTNCSSNGSHNCGCFWLFSCNGANVNLRYKKQF